MVDLNVRTGAGTWFSQKLFKDLTINAKLHSFRQNFAVLKKGTRVTCLETKIENKTATIKDLEMLNDTGLVYISDEIIEQIEALDNKSKEVKVDGDKAVLIKLIKDRAVSDSTIKELLLSQFINHNVLPIISTGSTITPLASR